MTSAAPVAVLLPLAAAPLMYLLRGRMAASVVAGVVGGVTFSIVLLVKVLLAAGPVRYPLGGWGAPIGVDLRVDGLAVFVMAVTAIVFTAVAAYAGAAYHARPEPEEGHVPSQAAAFWPLLLLLWASLNALALADDVFNLYVALELLGLSAVMLVTLEGGAAALTAGMRYLFASLLGATAYLVGVALLYTTYGALSLDALGGAIEPVPVAVVAFVSMTLGLALKAALFPFHGWLPAAHASAPTPVSALLSAIVVKGAFVVLLRLWVVVSPALLNEAVATFLGLLGAGAIVWGALLALRQERLKMIIAFSTVSQLGYLFVLLPVAHASGSAAAWQGGILHLGAHALAKAALFLSAGGVLWAIGSDQVSEMRGLAARAPMLVLGFGLAGVSLIGLPPSAGFLAKWLLVQEAVDQGQWGWAVVMVAGSLLTAAYIFRVLGVALDEEGRGEVPATPASVPRALEVTPLVLALVAMALGVWATGPLSLLSLSDGFPW
jgi:multicomponent Na+:H+ antiporter subunit D